MLLKLFLSLLLFSSFINAKVIELNPIEVVGYNIPDKAVNVTFGHGSEVYFLFVSPSCSHCVDLIDKLREYDMDKYTFKFILIDFMNKDFAAIELILNGHHGDKYDLISTTNQTNFKYILRKHISPEIAKIIKFNKDLFNKFGFRSVPVIISEDSGVRVLSIP